MPKTRIPTQKRSLEKYEKIVEAAFRLFNEKGYFNTTTADIAKESKVAVGSIYSYFLDKKEIYIEILRRISDKFGEPTYDYWSKKGPIADMDEESIKSLFHVFIKLMMEYHNFSKTFHDDMAALSLLDEEIAVISKNNEQIRNNRTKEVFDLIKIPFSKPENVDIYLHYCNLLFDDVCHTILYQSEIVNKDIYINHSVDMLYRLFLDLTDLNVKEHTKEE